MKTISNVHIGIESMTCYTQLSNNIAELLSRIKSKKSCLQAHHGMQDLNNKPIITAAKNAYLKLSVDTRLNKLIKKTLGNISWRNDSNYRTIVIAKSESTSQEYLIEQALKDNISDSTSSKLEFIPSSQFDTDKLFSTLSDFQDSKQSHLILLGFDDLLLPQSIQQHIQQKSIMSTRNTEGIALGTAAACVVINKNTRKTITISQQYKIEEQTLILAAEQQNHENLSALHCFTQPFLQTTKKIPSILNITASLGDIGVAKPILQLALGIAALQQKNNEQIILYNFSSNREHLTLTSEGV